LRRFLPIADHCLPIRIERASVAEGTDRYPPAGPAVRPNELSDGAPSYGQMAKTIDVVLHVVIQYARYPDPTTTRSISKWLNTAMDTKMMAFLSGCYPDVLTPWPKTIEQVKTREQYNVIQHTVRQFIQEEHQGNISSVDFDDIYWRVLNK
jgi:hypothetical protein